MGFRKQNLFFNYIIYQQNICIKYKKVIAIKQLFETKLIRNTKIFHKFAK